MANVNQLKIGNITYDVNDIRISTGSGAPSGGSNGDIYFRKDSAVTNTNGWNVLYHADGTCECWKIYNLGTVSCGTWGSYRTSDNKAGSLNYPVTFAETPAVIITAAGGGGPWMFTYASTVGSTTSSVPCGICGHMSSATNTYLYYYVRGRVA